MIQLFGVSKSYGVVAALDDVSLQVARGTLMLLTGASGAGKTTLLRTIFAAEQPDTGQVVIAGRNIARLRASSIPYLRRNVGVVFQDFRLLRDCSVWRNVALPLEIQGLPRKVVRERSQAVLGAVGLERAADTMAGALSGGEQQRVAIARALIAQPTIILADEPTGNLDPVWTLVVLSLLQEVARAGTTVIVATHDPLLIDRAADAQLVRLEAGRVVELRYPIDAPVDEAVDEVDELGDEALGAVQALPSPDGSAGGAPAAPWLAAVPSP
ncbi:MAG: ATP-binding cassette domain-containing protein [Proteobacteria bacterium]|nr:ATP-binding cassette domain-containing protein [Pseudomonadota bacterium]